MKKTGILILLLLTGSLCYSQEYVYNDNNSKEINLDLNTPIRTYNLKKADYEKTTKTEKPEENEMPFNFVSSPLQLLKQYQSDNY